MPEDRWLPDDPESRELRSRYLSSLGAVRPKLHRFCARMCGSVLDGEDLVQETLAAASYKISLANPGFLDPSVFKMALDRCLYFIQRDVGQRERIEVDEEALSRAMGPEPLWNRFAIKEPLFGRVGVLRPFDRTVIVFKDVLGYSFEELANLLLTSVGHLKMSLWRARATLHELPPLESPAPINETHLALLKSLADSYNRLDALALHRLVRADARVEMVGAFSGRFSDLDAMYAGSYAAIPWKWRQSVALVDGDPVLVTSRLVDTSWHPYSAVRIWWEGGQVVRIRDYMQIHYVLRDARIEPLSEPPATDSVEHG